MKNTTLALLAGALVAAALGLGYRLGQRADTPSSHAAAAPAAAGAPAASAPKQRKLLYYRNPMGLPDTSPTPKKDPMGMDYIPVYEGEEDDAPSGGGTLRISTEKVQKLGVRTERVALRPLGQTVRAIGRVEPDERRVAVVAPKFEGYVERLLVNVTGQPVAKSQPLFEAYSPELVAAQREYLVAVQGLRTLGSGDTAAGMRQLADAALAHLQHWGMSKDEIDALVRSGEVRRTLTFRSPAVGIVTEKKALQGMRFMPGEMLYQVTDLGAVWVVADVFEQDLARVRRGAQASLTIDAYPGRSFSGTVTYVYPTLKAETRTVPVRVELANPGGLLKPGMYAQVALAAGGPAAVLAVPDSAVIDSGTRRVVLVQLGEGRFQPREVKLGARGDAYVQVLDGVREGEAVVVAANFLIDAESNLKAALGGLGGAVSAPAAAPAAAGHRAEGTVDAIDTAAGTLTVSHGPVPSLKWPAMTMDFAAAHAGLLKGLAPGAKVRFEFVERQPGDWVITTITPAAAAASKAAQPHAGH